MPRRDKDLLTFLTPNATWNRYCEVFRKAIFKTVSGSGTNISRSAQLHKEGISKATAAVSAQISKFCFHRAVPGIKLSHHVLFRGWQTNVTTSQGTATVFNCRLKHDDIRVTDGAALPNLHFSNTWQWVISFGPWPLYLRLKTFWYSLNRRVGKSPESIFLMEASRCALNVI